jgi:hypothetical protein
MERLKGRLYARRNAEATAPAAPRAPLAPHASEVPVSWRAGEAPEPTGTPRAPLGQLMEESKPRMPFATKFLIGSAMFFAAATAAAAFTFFGGGNIVSSRNIDLQVIAPTLIDGGKEATMEIIITNRNRTALELADLIIDYPDGTRDPNDLTRALSHERQSIGTIRSGEQVKRTARAVFYGSEGAQQRLAVALEYTIAGSNAVFVKEGSADFVVGSSPVSLAIEMPQEAVAGEPFPVKVTVRSNAATTVENVLVEGQYPFGFTLLESSPSAEVGGLLWRLGALQPGTSKTITLTGMLDASEGDERVFRFVVGSDSDQTATRVRVPFLTQPQSVTVKRPFVAGSITVDGKSGSAISAAAGRTLPGSIVWSNNLPETLTDVEMTLTFEGPMLDSSSVSADSGFYQSGSRSITWTKSEDPSLARVAPGEGGRLAFSFATEAPGAGGTLYTNPTMYLNLIIRGTREGGGGGPQSVSSAANMRITLASNLSLTAQALHFDGPFTNSGPMPPRAGQQTSYAIVWTVRNSSNAVANGTVAATLPAYVRFIAGAPGSGITYDEGSRTVRWNVGEVSAGVGYTSPERQGAFQIMLTPSSSQVGQSVPLTGAAVLTGQDRFAQIDVQTSAEAATTILNGDSEFEPGMGTIEPE